MALIKKQLEVIDDLFENGGDEAAVLRKYNITHKRWKKWLADKAFKAAIADKVQAMHRQSQILAVQYVPMATAKLIQLCGGDKEETSRKACLDILGLQVRSSGQLIEAEADTGDDDEENMLDDETAAKLLAVLAEKK
ncbi:MAG: hypothetical protein WC770_08020 [Phycisphaerae bacterium]|jgi:hypothetical protein